MLKISVLVSGGGTNLQALIDAQNNGILSSGKIAQVISSRDDAYAIERAKKANIHAIVAKSEDEILKALDEVRPGIIVLAGMFDPQAYLALENQFTKGDKEYTIVGHKVEDYPEQFKRFDITERL